MRFGINLRGDLTKLDDAEIASRFEGLISELETKHKVVYQVGKWSARGVLHARIFYKIQAVIFGVLGTLGGALITPSGIELYLLGCELADVRDEIERRVRRRKTATAAS
jgi:hypothetical protein